MKPVIAATLCLFLVGIVATACDGNGLETPPTPESTPTAPKGVIGPRSLTGPQGEFMPPDPVTGVGEVHQALLQGRHFGLEVARTLSERARGLMERTSLPQDAAMLFVYESEEYLSFWMKNTLIPLDILFLDAQGAVVDVQTMHTQIGVSDGELVVYRSARPARFAIEMNAGFAEALKIEPGAQVLFR